MNFQSCSIKCSFGPGASAAFFNCYQPSQKILHIVGSSSFRQGVGFWRQKVCCCRYSVILQRFILSKKHHILPWPFYLFTEIGCKIAKYESNLPDKKRICPHARKFFYVTIFVLQHAFWGKSQPPDGSTGN